MTPIEKAVCEAGGVTALAKAIGTAQSFVSQMKSGDRPIPPRFCIPIEEAVGGVVTRYDLRPDIFGSSPSAHQVSVAS